MARLGPISGLFRTLGGADGTRQSGAASSPLMKICRPPYQDVEHPKPHAATPIQSTPFAAKQE